MKFIPLVGIYYWWKNINNFDEFLPNLLIGYYHTWIIGVVIILLIN